MRAAYGTVLVNVVVAVALAGCLAPAGPQPNRESAAGAVEDFARTVIAGDLDGAMAYFTDQWHDLGSNRTHEKSEQRSNLADYFESQHFKDGVKDRPLAQLVRVNEAFVLSHEEMQTQDGFRQALLEFGTQEGDFWVSFPASEGSPWSDGFGGLYRILDNHWVEIAGD